MHTINWVQQTREETEFHQKIFGTYNSFPPNWKEIHVDEFDFESATMIEYRQMYYPFGISPEERRYFRNGYISANLFYRKDGKGFAISRAYKSTIEGGKYKNHFFSFDAAPTLKEFYDSLPIKKDEGWKLNKTTSNSRRGIRDFDRRIIVERNLTDLELKYLRMWLYRDNCPGWTGVSHTSFCIDDCTFSYNFKTNHDSSD